MPAKYFRLLLCGFILFSSGEAAAKEYLGYLKQTVSSAKDGNAIAQGNLAIRYQIGEDVEISQEKAYYRASLCSYPYKRYAVHDAKTSLVTKAMELHDRQ